MTIERDYHHWTVQDAERDVELIIGQVRAQRTSEYAELITGFGVIRQHLLDLLQDYGLEPMLKHGNDGTITVMIE